MEVTVVSNDGATWAEVPVLAQTVTTGVCEALADCAPCGAGGIDIGPNKTRASGGAPYMIWRIHKEFPKVMELVLFSSNQSSQNSGLRLVFEHALCPCANVALAQVLKGSFAYNVSVLTVTGVLYCISLIVSSSSKSRSSMQVTKSIARDVCDELEGLRRVTSLAVSPELFIIGGQNGSILCLAVGSNLDTRPDHTFELKDGERGLSRLLGFKGRSMSPIKCLGAHLLAEAPLLFAMHEDNCLKVWDLAQRSRQFFQSISLPPDVANATITSVTVEDLPVVREGVRVAFQVVGDPSAEFQSATLVLYTLHTPQVDGGIRLTHLTLERVYSVGQGEVLSCKILNDGVWALQRGSDGQCHLWFAKVEETSLRKCTLMESLIAEQLFQSTGRSWDEFLFALHHTGLDSSSLEEMIPNFFLKRLLQPGVRKLAALKIVLQMRRRCLSDFEIGSLTLDGLRKEVKASVKGEVGNARKTLQDWMKFCSSYVESWNHNCVPYELFADVSTGSVGLIRKSSVSVIRALTPLEQHDYRCSKFDTKDVGLPQDWEHAPSDSAIIGALFICMRIVTEHLGPMALGIFHEVLLRSPPSHTLDGVISSFMEVLDVGYTPLDLAQRGSTFGLDEIRVKTQSYHQRQRKFAFHISLALRALRESAGGWEVVLEVVYKYTQYLLYSTEAANPASTSRLFPLGCVPTKMLAQATCQISWTHFEAARDLLLLLSYMIKARGQIGLSAIEVTKIQVTLLPQVQEGLVINLLLHWLSVTFAEVPPPEDYTLQLSSLRIDGSRGERVQPETLGAGEVTLGEILAAACLETTRVQETFHGDSLPSPEVLRDFAWHFIGWLLVGEKADPVSLTFSGRAISLSSILLQHGQYGSLDSFLNAVEQYSAPQPLSDGIASVDGDWSARLHLLGICSLARAQTTLGEAIKEKHIGEAIQCFFRAASGKGEASKVLQALFFVPQQQTQQATAGVEVSAKWKLQYFEWVMQLFDQYSLSEGACQFAHAALEQVDEAIGSSPVGAPSAGSNNTIKGRLWANVFKFSLDLELYGNAYCAITSNPDRESKDICLKRFVIVLCDRKASQALCGNELPYGSILSRVEEELVTKAHNSDVSVKSRLFKQLYSLHMHHHNVGRAAGYMYEYAMSVRHLQQAKPQGQSLSLLQEELDALAAAINALHLIESSEELVPSRIEWLSPAKRQRISADRLSNGQMIISNGVYANERRSLDVEQLVKEHALALARLQILKADSKTSSHEVNLPPSEVVQSLLYHGLYDMAFSLVFLCWKDSSQKQELEVVFESMARRCCLLQLQMGSGSPSKPSEEFRLALSPGPVVASNAIVSWGAPTAEATPQMQHQFGSDAKGFWEILRDYIEKYWKLHPNIRAVVANTILSVDRQMELPLWLVNTFKNGIDFRSTSAGNWEADPAALLRIYVEHERYVEAAYLLLEHLNTAARLRPSDVIKRKQSGAIWFPYTLVDRLLHCLSDFSPALGATEQFARLRSSLQNALAQHFELIKKESDDVRVIAGASNANGPWKGLS